MIAEAGDAPLLHLGEKARSWVAFTIEHHGKAMKLRIVVEAIVWRWVGSAHLAQDAE